MEVIFSNWPSWLVFGVLGIVGTQLWTKFRNRITVLRYQIVHTYLGASASDVFFGTLKVFLNDVEYTNLYLTNVSLTNDTGTDLVNLEINIVSDSQTEILGSYGNKSNSLKFLPFADGFQDFVNRAVTGDASAAAYMRTRRDYQVPVLNRSENITLTLLTTNAAGAQPMLSLECDHKGVRLKQAPAVPHIYGEPQQLSAMLGFAIVLLLAWPIIELIPSKSIAVVVGITLGVFCLLFGIGVRKLYKLIVRLGTQ